MRSALAASTFLAAVPLLLPAGVAYAACNTSDTNQTCTNNATISGGAVGVFDTGTLTLSNIAPGSITGSNRGLAAAAAVIVTTNTGSITGTTDDAIFAGTNATVTNNAGGTVTGGFNGIAANIAAEVINSGTITAPNFTIFASNVTVTNNVGGTITGIGAIIAGVNANVTNSGHIGGGISASTNATVTNNIGGTITSNFFGIRANSGTANVFNFGSITGTSGIVAGAASTVFNAGTVTGTGGTAMSFGAAGSNLTIAPTSIINGNVLAAAGSNTFQLGGTGTGTFDISALGPAQQYQNFDIVNKVGASTWTATGTSTYAGATTVNAGTLSVNGDISSSSGVTVNNGGTLGGTGILPSTVIASGGTLAPGNSVGTITVNGNLTFNGGSTYAVEVSGAAADRTNVTGTATLAGTVQAAFASVTMLKQYTILHSAGLVGTFGAFTYTNPNISAGLSYTATDVLLNVTGASLGAGGSLTGNQQNVAGSINTFFNNGGTLPPAFGSLFGLTGGNLGNALSQLSGEAATGSQQSAFQLTNQFFGIMLDPFADGRDGIGGGPALGFAREGAALPDDAALAYASALKPPATNASFEQRWSAWGSAYGGVNNSSRDSAAVGSHDLTARAYGFAVGFDYRVSRDTR